MYKELKECIICSNPVEQVLSLGNQYVVDFVKEKDESLLKADLTLMRCTKCSFIQLKYRVDPDRLYKKFWYRSGINKMMKDELLRIVQTANATVELNPGDTVLDIGCNDGTLLGWYPKQIVTVGIDPCADLVEEGLKTNKIDIGIPDYFSATNIKSLRNLVLSNRSFKVITAIAMFYDVDNPVQFLKDCKELLHDKGVLVIQMNYLVKMLADTAFDNVSHEHLGYYSVSTLKTVVEKAGLELQGVEESSCNGGSIRAYITHKGFDAFSIKNSSNKLWLWTKLNQMLLAEMHADLHTNSPYLSFANDIEAKVNKINKTLEDVKDKKIFAYGASTRGTVLTQHCLSAGANWECNGVAERDTNKIGLMMVGSWWPIVSEDQFRAEAKVGLVLPWHFKDGILTREKTWLINGGQLLFPLPKPVIELHDSEALFTTVGTIL